MQTQLFKQNLILFVFVAIVDIKLKSGVEDDFARSFSDANAELSKCDGFLNRRLLKSGDGSLRIVVEHQTRDTFEKMHQSDIHAKWHEKMTSFMEQMPSPRFYKVVAQ